MFGFLNVYKPKGMTSHDVVSVLRRVTKIKQIGHTGTLDPFAGGVLPVCIGKATRLIEYLDDDKAYVGTVQLGSSTTTYDLEGEGVNFSDKRVNLSEIERALDEFRGEIEQLPPIYSAIKVKGKKLYEYAREGKEVKIEPRRVNITKLEVLGYDEANRRLTLNIECSKGTYIRSIANDLGVKLNTFGHLIKLVRVKAGRFEVDDAVPLEQIQTREEVEKFLVSPLEVMDFERRELNAAEAEQVANGMSIRADGAGVGLSNGVGVGAEGARIGLSDGVGVGEGGAKGGIIILTYGGKLAAVAEVQERLIRCRKVFL